MIFKTLFLLNFSNTFVAILQQNVSFSNPYSMHSHPDSLHSYPDLPHSHPDSLHSQHDILHTHHSPHPHIPTPIRRILTQISAFPHDSPLSHPDSPHSHLDFPHSNHSLHSIPLFLILVFTDSQKQKYFSLSDHQLAENQILYFGL